MRKTSKPSQAATPSAVRPSAPVFPVLKHGVSPTGPTPKVPPTGGSGVPPLPANLPAAPGVGKVKSSGSEHD